MSSGSGTSPAEQATNRPAQAAAPASPQHQPPYHVVLLNDDDHSYDYVIDMLRRLFGHDEMLAFAMAREVDTTGSAIVDTTTLERAELKRDQILAYGPDPKIPQCAGSMTAVIRAAE